MLVVLLKYDEGRGSGYVRLQFSLVAVHTVKGSQAEPNGAGIAVCGGPFQHG